eukprot:tig00020554_g10921.t1
MSAPKRAKVEEDTADVPYEQLESVQEKIEKINEEASEEVLAIEKKFNVKRRPLYKERSALLAKIPNFWLTIFTNHEVLSENITDADCDVLKYLKEIDIEDNEDLKSGYKISLYFDENPYFSNKVLTKEYKYAPDGELDVRPTAINWKAGHSVDSLSQEVDVEAEDDEENDEAEAGDKRKREVKESFFGWFSPDSPDTDLAEILKEDIWPNPLRVYMMDGADDDDDEGGDGDEGGDEEGGGSEEDQ